MKSRLKKISNILIHYSTGNFEAKIPVSGNLDEIDAVIAGINMLGEELKTTTISRNFFNDIFNSVSEMIFVVDQQGMVSYANQAALEKLAPVNKKLVGLRLDRFITDQSPPVSKLIREHLKRNKPEYETELNFRSRDRKTIIPAKCFITRLNSAQKKDPEYLVTVHDLSKIKAFEL